MKDDWFNLEDKEPPEDIEILIKLISGSVKMAVFGDCLAGDNEMFLVLGRNKFFVNKEMVRAWRYKPK